MFKKLEFKESFERLEASLYFNGVTEKIESFGIQSFNKKIAKHKQYAEQIKINDYIDENNFIITLFSKDGEEILLAKINPEKTLPDTYLTVAERIKKSDGKDVLSRGCVVQIPILRFAIDHSYEVVCGKNLLNKGFTDYFIHMAKQKIRFNLDENGAIVKSSSMIQLQKSLSEEPIYLVFDKPFFICLKEKNAQYPYLAMWIANEELMMPYTD